MLFFLFLCWFLLCGFFLLCHFLLSPYKTKNSLHTITETIENPANELSKRPKAVAIVFIVQIPDNPSEKILPTQFSVGKKSFMMVSYERKENSFIRGNV
jgi:hypothetical protein